MTPVTQDQKRPFQLNGWQHAAIYLFACLLVIARILVQAVPASLPMHSHVSALQTRGVLYNFQRISLERADSIKKVEEQA